MSANKYAFKAESRDGTGKGSARALRRAGLVPAVIYGDNKEPVTISLPMNDTNVEYNKGQMFTALCDLEVGNDKHLVLARDVQTHPVTDAVLHIDFLRVTKKTQIAVYVPVEFINEDKSPGLRDGGVFDVVRYEVELRCSAMEIPENIQVNMEGKEIGDSVKISDATMPEGTKPVIDDRDFTIANIAAPKTIEELEAEEEAADAEIEASEAGEGEATEGDSEASADGGEGEEAKEAKEE
ncbi:MAG: 50S ribosomal protein L25/general stress protein Ctc [Pseudomonadota bacterium]